MRKIVLFVGLLMATSAMLLMGCGPGGACKAGVEQACDCGDQIGKRTCKQDGSGFGICICGNNPTETTSEVPQEKLAETVQEKPGTGEAVADGGHETTSPEERTGQEALVETAPETPVTCGSNEFSWQDNCYQTEDFCKGVIQVPGFPAFSQEDQAKMVQPFEVVFDSSSKRPLFCKTKPGFYYLTGIGYGTCDNDKDGWINIEAYRAVTSTIQHIQENARCELRTFKAIVYYKEGDTTGQVQMLEKEASMVETFRNDGGSAVKELPLYTKNQAALPKSGSSICQDDNDCSSGQACFQGHCLEGRRFEPAEINTLTKACIANLDLNDNKIDDSSESPSDTPNPATEFKPLLAAGYFIELHYGHHQKDYDHNGTKMGVYHVYERSRAGSGQKALALKCQEKTNAFVPDFWKRCALKDNQQCPDPSDPTKTRGGLSQCWMKDVKRLTPSLFKCVAFDNTTNQTQQSGYFHPANYGFSKNYNRTICNFKSTVNTSDPTKRDFEFTCTADDGNRAPDASKKEVGWACISFKEYLDPKEYVGSCVDQRVEKVCGETKDGQTVTYVKLETDSYGMARASALCGPSNGQGDCSKAIRVCSGGTWYSCNKCNECPQSTPGQKSACPAGVWSKDSCKLQGDPAIELCDGKDNDCDGKIDNGVNKLTYYKDSDGDGYGTSNDTQQACPGTNVTGYVLLSGDCDDNNKQINPGVTDDCDGKDNNCNGLVDEHSIVPPTTNWYADSDGDGYGSKTPAFQACQQGGTTGTILCNKTSGCFSITASSGNNYTQDNSDCCDADADVHPKQTQYFSTPNKCGGWDYNCNNKNEADIGICQCQKTVAYKTEFSSTCQFSGTSYTWGNLGNISKNDTAENSTSCEMNVKLSYQPTKAHEQSISCSSGGSKTFTCNPSDVTSTWQTQLSSGDTAIAINAKAFDSATPNGGGCAILMNGNKPTCGNSVQVASTKENTPSWSSGEVTICSGTQKLCLKSHSHDCKYTLKFTYSSSSYYFKRSGLGSAVVKCR